MPSAQVSVWVPLVVALVGLGGVLGAQLVAGWREDRRWQREVQREELRWRREQERRRHDGREDAYARAIGTLEAWQWVLHPVKERVLKRRDPLTDEQRERLSAASDAAREMLGPMNLHAPDRVRNLMRDAVLTKADLTDGLLALPGPAEAGARITELRDLYHLSLRYYYAMRAAMRQDLGIDAEPGEPAHEVPPPYDRNARLTRTG